MCKALLVLSAECPVYVAHAGPGVPDLGPARRADPGQTAAPAQPAPPAAGAFDKGDGTVNLSLESGGTFHYHTEGDSVSGGDQSEDEALYFQWCIKGESSNGGPLVSNLFQTSRRFLYPQ